MSSYINYGIDLGTTNSSIAKWEGSDVRIFRNNDQMDVTPSVVRIEKSGRIIVGRRAYATAFSDPDNVACEFKRWMGQKDQKRFRASGRSLTPEELSAEVLKALLGDARRLGGEEVTAAVITVPAAFGALQCEATARAAQLAGLEEAPLLQEPIASAITYGISPGARDQKWLVYDLGGGTFDVAVISTKDGHLNVVEHRGNNLLGGKDIDRVIVEKIFLPALKQNFSLPDGESDRNLIQRLRLKAEEAKIDLSTTNSATVSLFDVGEDRDGRTIELELEVSCEEINELCRPLIEQSLELCDEALEGAGISAGDLSRVLLVGGPTQMPIVRQALRERLGAEVDSALDPMTVVARGAAIYASTLELTRTGPSHKITADTVRITLAYEGISADLRCPVAGRIESGGKPLDYEVQIDSESGHWTSGWIPLQGGSFEVNVVLLEGKSCRYWIYARDRLGRALKVDPDSFTIRHGLTLAAPPLPHTISAEVARADGKSELDVIFPRRSSLPVEKECVYRASKTLRPSECGDELAIKIWEGEILSDPQANEWVGVLRIRAEDIQRPIPEGAEIHITIRIDTSRLMSVEAFIRVINQHFTGNVYVAQREQEDFAAKAANIPEQVLNHLERLEKLEQVTEDDQVCQEVEVLRREIEDLDLESMGTKDATIADDPDRAKRIVESSKKIRGKLSQLERRAERQSGTSRRAAEMEAAEARAEEVIGRWGTENEKKEFELLRREGHRAAARSDDRRIRRVVESFKNLQWRVLFNQDWFWREVFDSLRVSGRNFTNPSEAMQWIAKGEEALSVGDADALQDAVRHLWELQPKAAAEIDREKALQTGIRRA